MKRLLVYFGIMLIESNIFSQQYGGLLSGISQTPAYEFRDNAFSWMTENGISTYTLTPQKFKVMLENEQFTKRIGETTYSFTDQGKFYMLSYDLDTLDIPNLNWRNNMRVERGLYLFRLDENGWTRTCDKPLQIDFKEQRDSKWNYCAYFPWRFVDDSKLRGEVERLPTGEVHIRIINHKMTDYGNPKESISYFYHDVVLTPNGIGKYSVQE